MKINWFRKRFVDTVIKSPDYSLPLQQYMLESDSCSPNQSACRAYTFSNENMYQTFKHFDCKDKKVATVGSSGDQAFNALYYGASDVTIIDANIYTKHIVDLKIASIKNLDYNEFHRVWGDNKIIDYKIYAKISHDLPKDSQIFWDCVYLDSGDRESRHIYDKLFFHQLRDDYSLSEMFDTEENYYKLRDILKNKTIKFVNADFSQFSQKLKSKYDVILLSNLYDYPSKVGNTPEQIWKINNEHDKDFCDEVNELINNNLRKNGSIQLYSSIRGKPDGYVMERFKKYLDTKKIYKYKIHRYRKANQFVRENNIPINRPFFNDEYFLYVYKKDNSREM